MRRAAAAALACVLLVACQPKPKPKPDDSVVDKQVRAAVTAMLEGWAKARTDGDWDGVAKLYADDEGFAWVERGQVRFANRAAAVAGLDGAKAASSKMPTKLSEIVVTPVSDEAAAFHARVKVEADYGDAAPPVDADAILTGVAFEYDGAWKFLEAHMEPRPAAPAPAAAPTAPDATPH